MELSLKQVFGIRQTDYYSTNSGVQPSDYLDCLWNIQLKKDRQERRLNPSQRNSICQFLGEHLWHEKYHFKICFSKVLLFCHKCCKHYVFYEKKKAVNEKNKHNTRKQTPNPYHSSKLLGVQNAWHFVCLPMQVPLAIFWRAHLSCLKSFLSLSSLD